MEEMQRDPKRARVDDPECTDRSRCLAEIKERIATTTHITTTNLFVFLVIKCLKMCVRVLEDTDFDVNQVDVLEAMQDLEHATFRTPDDPPFHDDVTDALVNVAGAFNWCVPKYKSGEQSHENEHQFIVRVLDAFPFGNYNDSIKFVLNETAYIDAGYNVKPLPSRKFPNDPLPPLTQVETRVAYVESMVSLAHACEHMTDVELRYFVDACKATTPPDVFGEASKHLAEAGYEINPKRVPVEAV